MEDQTANSFEVKETGPVESEPEKMECDEALSGEESAEMTEEKTDSSLKATDSDEQALPMSPLASDTTSGIEMRYESAATLPPDTPLERASESTGETPAVVSEPAEVVSEETVRVTAAVSESAGEDGATASACLSPPKPGIFETVRNYTAAIFSPRKGREKSTSPKERSTSPKEKSKEIRRSKSMSPPEKKSVAAGIKTLEPVSEACMSDGEESFKKGGEKKSRMAAVKRTFSKLVMYKSKSVAEVDNLVPNEERLESPPPEKVPVKKEHEPAPAPGNADAEPLPSHMWTENRQSLTERPSLTLTTTTDVPTTWSGLDVFPSDESRAHSGENTSEEAVVGSLTSSPDEQIPDIVPDKNVPEGETPMEQESVQSLEKEIAEGDIKDKSSAAENSDAEKVETENDEKPKPEE